MTSAVSFKANCTKDCAVPSCAASTRAAMSKMLEPSGIVHFYCKSVTASQAVIDLGNSGWMIEEIFSGLERAAAMSAAAQPFHYPPKIEAVSAANDSLLFELPGDLPGGGARGNFYKCLATRTIGHGQHEYRSQNPQQNDQQK